jgi:RHS repeat-associated protein
VKEEFEEKTKNSSVTTIDALSYGYYTDGAGNQINRLSSVRDGAGNKGMGDVDASNTYAYDAIGQLIQETSTSQGLTITWTPYGKVSSVSRANRSSVFQGGHQYLYDGMGNQVRDIWENSAHHFDTTYVIYDGNNVQLARYHLQTPLPVGGRMAPAERYLYGSDKLGMLRGNNVVGYTVYWDLVGGVFVRRLMPYVLAEAPRVYELHDHLGNVRATIEGTTPPASGVTASNYYNYYAFGSYHPWRNLEGGTYRFGFNGQEKKDDWRGAGNSDEFKYREYDSRIGRFTAIDPLTKNYPWNSPYAFCENRPIDGRDLEGKEYENYKSQQIVKDKGVAALQVINADHGSGPLEKATYHLKIHGTQASFNRLKEAYTTNPGKLHNSNNPYAQYNPLKKSEHIGVGDNMQIKITALKVVKMDIYVRFTDLKVNEQSFSLTAATLFGHTDAGFINFAATFNPKTGIIDFMIHNETTNNMGLDLLTMGRGGRSIQESQWKIVLNNVQEFLGGAVEEKNMKKEIMDKAAKIGDVVKEVFQNLITGKVSEAFKKKDSN